MTENETKNERRRLRRKELWEQEHERVRGLPPKIHKNLICATQQDYKQIGGHVRVPHALLRSPAWRVLSSTARNLFLHAIDAAFWGDCDDLCNDQGNRAYLLSGRFMTQKYLKSVGLGAGDVNRALQELKLLGLLQWRWALTCTGNRVRFFLVHDNIEANRKNDDSLWDRLAQRCGKYFQFWLDDGRSAPKEVKPCRENPQTPVQKEEEDSQASDEDGFVRAITSVFGKKFNWPSKLNEKQTGQVAKFAKTLAKYAKKGTKDSPYPTIAPVAWAEMFCSAAIDYIEERKLPDFYPGNLASDKFKKYLDSGWLKEHFSWNMDSYLSAMSSTGHWSGWEK